MQEKLSKLEEENKRLKEEVETLKKGSFRQAAPFRRLERNKVKPWEKKKSGRKKGHKGSCRSEPDHIDERVEVSLSSCPDCGHDNIKNISKVRQVIEEIPPVKPKVFEVITYTGECPYCDKKIRSTHPLQTSLAQGAASVHLGPRALSLASMLNKQLGLTVRTTGRVLKELLGLTISPGGITQAVARVADKVKGDYADLIKEIQTKPAVFADETSWWVGEPKWWLWTFTSQTATVYRVEKSRGSEIVEKVLGDNFKGMLVSDCLAIYNSAPYPKHKCIAHHLKAISEQMKGQANPDYLRRWKVLFQTVIALYYSRDLFDEDDFAEKRRNLEKCIKKLLDEPGTQPGDERIRYRLSRQKSHLVGCLYEPMAEPTNNRAERSLRPAVIARKLSCGNKTIRGKKTWEILVSLAETCYLRGENFVDFLTPKLRLEL